MKNNSEFMSDCVHLKACRRLQVIAKNNGHPINARGCTKDCTAYESKNDYYTKEEAETIMHGAFKDGYSRFSCDPYDVLLEDYVRR